MRELCPESDADLAAALKLVHRSALAYICEIETNYSRVRSSVTDFDIRKEKEKNQ